MKFLLIGTLALLSFSTFACLKNGNVDICPGDIAVVDYADGKIIGINPSTRKISINFEVGQSSARGIGTYNIDQVTVGKGCLAGYCVGDTAVVDYADGKIIGINPSTRKISINFEVGQSSARGIGTYNIDQVTVGKGCLAGYCVGDTAVVDYADGKIIGINPSTRKISINFEVGKSSARGIGTYNIDQVTVSSYCLEFDENNSARNIQGQSDFDSLFQK